MNEMLHVYVRALVKRWLSDSIHPNEDTIACIPIYSLSQ